MADIKVSQLPTAAKLNPADLLMAIQSGNNKKIPFSSFLGNVTTNVVINSENSAVSLRIKGSVGNDNLLVTDPVANKIGVGTNAPDELLHVSGNLKVGGDGVSGVIINSTDEVLVDGTASKSANVTTSITMVDFSGSSTTLTLNLGSGSPNQKKCVIITGSPVGGSCNVTVVPAPYNGTTPLIKLAKKGDVVNLLYTTDGWMVMGYYGASIT
jgi:hypothetical protein